MKKLRLLSFLFLFLMVASCKKDDSSSLIEKTDLLISGYKNTDAAGNNADPCYWKNFELKNLPKPDAATSAVPYQIFTKGTDVYIAGISINATAATASGCYWKNEVVTTLPSPAGASTTFAQHIAVTSNNDVYVSGVCFLDGNYTSLLWKNGEIIFQTNSTTNPYYLLGVTTNGNDVYAVMANLTGDASFVWKNGTITSWANGGTLIERIITNGQDVYYVGRERISGSLIRPVYWKNTISDKTVISTEESSSGSLIGISLSNGNLAILFGSNLSGYFTWVNGTKIVLNTSPSNDVLSEMTAWDSDLYSIGISSDQPFYIKNTTPVLLPTGNFGGAATGITVHKYMQ